MTSARKHAQGRLGLKLQESRVMGVFDIIESVTDGASADR